MLLRDSTGLRASLGLLARIPNLLDRWEEWIHYQQSWVSIESHGAATGAAPHGDLIKILLS